MQSKNYDFVLIDCAPSTGLINVNALAAADSLLISCQPQPYSVNGLDLDNVLNSIKEVRNNINSKLEIKDLLITMIDYRISTTREITEQLRNHYGKAINVFKTTIPYLVREIDRSALGISIYKCDPKGAVAEAYSASTKEVMHHVKTRNRTKSQISR